MMRNFSVKQEPALNCTIAEALLTILAVPPLFIPSSIYKDSATFEYTSGDLALSNPVREILAEAYRAFGPDGRVACLLSLGCGHLGVISVPDDPNLANWNIILERLVGNSGQTAREVGVQMGHLGIYHRYSITRGLEGLALTTATKSGEVLSHTAVYLGEVTVSRNLDACVSLLRIRDGGASLYRAA